MVQTLKKSMSLGLLAVLAQAFVPGTAAALGVEIKPPLPDRLCGWNYPSRGYAVVTRVPAGAINQCNDAIYQLGRFNSPDARRVSMASCETVSSILGFGQVNTCNANSSNNITNRWVERSPSGATSYGAYFVYGKKTPSNPFPSARRLYFPSAPWTPGEG